MPVFVSIYDVLVHMSERIESFLLDSRQCLVIEMSRRKAMAWFARLFTPRPSFPKTSWQFSIDVLYPCTACTTACTRSSVSPVVSG